VGKVITIGIGSHGNCKLCAGKTCAKSEPTIPSPNCIATNLRNCCSCLPIYAPCPRSRSSHALPNLRVGRGRLRLTHWECSISQRIDRQSAKDGHSLNAPATAQLRTAESQHKQGLTYASAHGHTPLNDSRPATRMNGATSTDRNLPTTPETRGIPDLRHGGRVLAQPPDVFSTTFAIR
jgi:hypothetical protein